MFTGPGETTTGKNILKKFEIYLVDKNITFIFVS